MKSLSDVHNTAGSRIFSIDYRSHGDVPQSRVEHGDHPATHPYLANMTRPDKKERLPFLLEEGFVRLQAWASIPAEFEFVTSLAPTAQL